jgi:hypothetical protein
MRMLEQPNSQNSKHSSGATWTLSQLQPSTKMYAFPAALSPCGGWRSHARVSMSSSRRWHRRGGWTWQRTEKESGVQVGVAAEAVSRCGKPQTNTRRRQSPEVTAPPDARGGAPHGTFLSAEGACTPACAARLHGAPRSGGHGRNLAAGGKSIFRRHERPTGAQAGMRSGSPLPAFVQIKQKHNCRGPALRGVVHEDRAVHW